LEAESERMKQTIGAPTTRLLLAVMLWLGLAPHLQGATTAGRTLVIQHVNVIPMTVPGILVDQTVIIRGQRIIRIGSASQVRVPGGSWTLNGSGQYLIPGLIDAHVHLYNRQQLGLYLISGVTTVFNLNGAPLHLVWREEIAKGHLLGPRIYTVGPKFDRAEPPEKAAALVNEYFRQGYDGIKIYDQVSKAEYPALIAAAKERHMLIVGHIAREPGFEATLQAGQAIAHAEEYLSTFFKEHQNGGLPDPKLIPQAVSMTKAAGVPVIATLVAYEHILDQATDFPAFLKRPEMQYWAPWEMEDLKDPDENPYLSFGKDDIAELQHNYPLLRTLVKALHDDGVPILAGTDAGWVIAVPGFGLHQELQNLVDTGMTPFEALYSATVAPARFLRGDNGFGTVEEGKVADLVLLRANPFDSISNTQNIAGVVVRGRWLPNAELDKMQQQIPESYAQDKRVVEEDLLHNPRKAVAFLKDNDPAPFELSTAVLRTIGLREGVPKLEEAIRASHTLDPETPLDLPDVLNDVGDYFLDKQKETDAIELFRFNVAQHPQSAIACDRLARAYYKLGQYERSLQFYEKALDLDSTYWNADFAKRRIGKLQEQLASPRN